MSWVPLVFLILVALACFFFALNLKRTVLTKLSDQGTTIVGQKVFVQDISFHFPAILDLYGIVVKNPEGFPSGDLLRIKRLHLNMHLSQLLRGHFSLRRLVAFSPEVELVKNERMNMSLLGGDCSRHRPSDQISRGRTQVRIRTFYFSRDPAPRSKALRLYLRTFFLILEPKQRWKEWSTRE
jgi:hypothetical protein